MYTIVRRFPVAVLCSPPTEQEHANEIGQHDDDAAEAVQAEVQALVGRQFDAVPEAENHRATPFSGPMPPWLEVLGNRPKRRGGGALLEISLQVCRVGLSPA